jgi:hypothetical protein
MAFQVEEVLIREPTSPLSIGKAHAGQEFDTINGKIICYLETF